MRDKPPNTRLFYLLRAKVHRATVIALTFRKFKCHYSKIQFSVFYSVDIVVPYSLSSRALTNKHFNIFPLAQQLRMGQGLLIIKASRSHSDTPHSVGLPWTCDEPVAETSTRRHTTVTRYRHPCSGGIEPAIPASERKQTTP
jgi:hypothetical protein